MARNGQIPRGHDRAPAPLLRRRVQVPRRLSHDQVPRARSDHRARGRRRARDCDELARGRPRAKGIARNDDREHERIRRAGAVRPRRFRHRILGGDHEALPRRARAPARRGPALFPRRRGGQAARDGHRARRRRRHARAPARKAPRRGRGDRGGAARDGRCLARRGGRDPPRESAWRPDARARWSRLHGRATARDRRVGAPRTRVRIRRRDLRAWSASRRSAPDRDRPAPCGRADRHGHLPAAQADALLGGHDAHRLERRAVRRDPKDL